jgi:hypothetical protein
LREGGMDSKYTFRIFGPFTLKREKAGAVSVNSVSRSDLKAQFTSRFQESDVGSEQDIDAAIGLYVKGIRSSGGAIPTPWYVGKAVSQSIISRLYNGDKAETWGRVIENSGKTKFTPVVYLLPLFTPTGRLVNPTKRDGPISTIINYAENKLIAEAYSRNKDLINVKGTKFLEKFQIAYSEADYFDEMLGKS